MGLLDENFYPFDDPAGEALWNKLADLYEAKEARSLALRAGVRGGAINFDGRPVDVWQDLLDFAAKSRKLRSLAQVILKDDESVAVRSLLESLMADVPQPLPAGLDQYSLGMLPSHRAFINRFPLRRYLREEFSDPNGARVLLVNGASGLGKSHSWHLISYIGDRVGAYQARRFDLADRTGPKLSAHELMTWICAELDWRPAEVDPASQPDTAVRLLVSVFKSRTRNLSRPVCLVFDGFTSGTSDEFARRLVIGMADAANKEQDVRARVVMLEVEAPLPDDLARDALSENLGHGRLDDLPKFFEAAATAIGEEVDAGAMGVLMDIALGPPPHPAEFALSTIGPKAAKIAGTAFRESVKQPGPPAPRTVGAAEIRRRLAGIEDELAESPPDLVSEPRWRLRTAAVLRGFFKAGDLAAQVQAAGGEITDDDLKAFIPRDCEAVSTARGRGWQLSLAVRAGTVRHLGADPRRLLQTTHGVPADQADLGRTMAELYLRGEAPAVPAQSPDQLTGSLLAVGWLSGVDLGLPAAGQLRLQLQLSTLLEPLRSLLDKLFVGRSDQLRRLTEYAGRPAGRPLVIHGPGGMGKSTLIARFLLDRPSAAGLSRLPFAYLTFDRPELLPQRPLGLLAEMIRQLSLQDPGVAAVTDETVAALEQTQRGVTGSEAEGSRFRSQSGGVVQRRQRDADELVDRFAGVVNSIGAESVVCVLDTFERAQRQGAAAVGRLWDVLDQVRYTVPSLRIVIVGRAGVTGYPVEDLALTKLGPDEMETYLSLRAEKEDVDVDRSLIEAIAKRTNGNPLRLRLAADLMVREAGPLRTAAGRRKFLLELEGDQIQGVLYRRVLAHIDDDDVRKLAIPGLALRRITAEVIQEVLAPACHLGPVSRDRAGELFGKLRKETSLVTDEGDVLVHRADVRHDILPLLASEDPDGVASIHRYAVRFYGERDTVADRTEELYHRLALGQAASTLDRRWDDEAGARLDAALDELPPASQAYLATRLDIEADPAALRAADDEAWARQATRSARGYLDAGNPAAALDVLRQRELSVIVFDHAALEVETLARLGRPAGAQKLVGRARDAASEAGNKPEFVRFSLLGAQICEDAGNFPRALTQLTEAREQAKASGDVVNSLVAGVGSLRVLRRSGRQGTRRARDLRTDVLAEAGTLSRRQRAANPSLVRDLAAEGGADLPDYVVEASKLVGLDVKSQEARDHLIGEGKGASVAKADEILEASRRERGHDAPVTSDQQGAAVSDYLEHSEAPEDYDAVADLFQSEADQRAF